MAKSEPNLALNHNLPAPYLPKSSIGCQIWKIWTILHLQTISDVRNWIWSAGTRSVKWSNFFALFCLLTLKLGSFSPYSTPHMIVNGDCKWVEVFAGGLNVTPEGLSSKKLTIQNVHAYPPQPPTFRPPLSETTVQCACSPIQRASRLDHLVKK